MEMLVDLVLTSDSQIIIMEGESAVNEAALTGESIPVEKQRGSNVSAATINTSGYLLCEATRVGEDTTLAGIIRMVSDAAATKAPIAKIADNNTSVIGRMFKAGMQKVIWDVCEIPVGNFLFWRKPSRIDLFTLESRPARKKKARPSPEERE